jgi:hypothetical protein
MSKNHTLFAFTGRETEDLIAMGTIWSPNSQTSVKQLNSSTSSAGSVTNNSISNVTGRNMHVSTSQGTASSTGLPQTSRTGRYNVAGMKPILVQTSKISNMKDGKFLSQCCFSLYLHALSLSLISLSAIGMQDFSKYRPLYVLYKDICFTHFYETLYVWVNFQFKFKCPCSGEIFFIVVVKDFIECFL